MQKIEPTKEEKKAGWTADTLSEYIRQREKAAVIRVFGPDDKKRKVLRVQNTKKFRPLYWGKKKR